MSNGMLLDHAPLPTADAESAQRPGWSRFPVHALALLVVLAAVALLVDDGYSAITDEGAVIAQVIGASDGTWRLDLPFAATDPAVDPEGRFVPMENSDVVDGAYLPYAKHPAYPALLVPFWKLAGHAGLLLASALGAWAAALAGSLLTRRLLPEGRLAVAGRSIPADVAALWLLGLGTPLVFDATVVMAHGIAAATLGFTVLTVLRGLVAHTRVQALAWSTASMTLAAATTLLRSEGLLAIGALSATIGVFGLLGLRPRGRDDRWEWGSASGVPADLQRRRCSARASWCSLCLAASGAGAYLLDGRLAALLVGGDGVTPFVTTKDGYDLVAGRAQALWSSVLRTGDPTGGSPAVVVFAATILTVAAAVLIRRRGPVAVTTLLLVGAATLLLARHLLPEGQITGMVPTVPLALVGLVQLRRSDLATVTARLLLGTAALTGLAVWTTSYSIGGASEWGGRFYHVVLPLLAPLAVVGLARAAEAVTDRRQAVLGAGALVVATASLTGLWVRTDMEMRHTHAVLVEATAAAASAARPPADGGRPVVVSDPRGLGRVMWPHLGELRFMRASEVDDLDDALSALASTDVDTVLLAVSPSIDLVPVLDDNWTVHRSHPAGLDTWRMLELHRV